MSDTPRTDSILRWHYPDRALPEIREPYTELAEHARTLERELAACQRDLEMTRSEARSLGRLQPALDECQREREAMRNRFDSFLTSLERKFDMHEATRKART